MKNKIDLKVISFKVFNDLIGNLYPSRRVIPDRNISNPFLPSKPKSPSFCISKCIINQLLYRNYEFGDYSKCLNLTQSELGLNNSEAIEKIIKIKTV